MLNNQNVPRLIITLVPRLIITLVLKLTITLLPRLTITLVQYIYAQHTTSSNLPLEVTSSLVGPACNTYGW